MCTCVCFEQHETFRFNVTAIARMYSKAKVMGFIVVAILTTMNLWFTILRMHHTYTFAKWGSCPPLFLLMGLLV
jgi:hypothetical protein